MPPKGRSPKKKRNISSHVEIPSMGDNQSDNNTDSDRNQEEDQPPNDLKDMGVNRRMIRIQIQIKNLIMNGKA
jgi:hypothetical protein